MSSDFFILAALIVIAPHLKEQQATTASKWFIAGAIFFGLPAFIRGLGLLIADILTVLS